MIYTEDEKQKVLDWFIARNGRAALASSVMNQIQKKVKLTGYLAKITAILQELLDEGLIESTQNDIRHGKLFCTIKTPEPEHQRHWKELLSDYPEALPLDKCADYLEDWKPEGMKKLLEGMLSLKSDLPEAYEMTAYEASARYLLSSSKLLDSLDKKRLLSFGIDIDRFKPKTTYMVIAGPDQPEQVLLVENPQSFEACISADLHQHTGLVCTYGYGLQWSQVFNHLDSIVGLVRTGSSTLFLPELLNHSKLFFWGDFDSAGIEIYQSIQARRPQCLLSNLYIPLLKKQAHHYCKTTGKDNQKSLDWLNTGVDQESLSQNEILEFCSGGLSLSEFKGLHAEHVCKSIKTN